MKLNAGIITENMNESKKFYQEYLDFGVTFENEFYLLMHTPDKTAELSFLMANHPTQQPIYHTPYPGHGIYLTIEVDDVDDLYKRIKNAGIEMAIDIRDEPWGDRHFSILDPNGVAIDIVKYSPSAE